MSGQAPWHLWGNTQTFTIPGFTIPGGGAGADVDAPAQQGQLCRVPYLRPDTFHFLFASTVLGGLTAGADVQVILTVDFDLIVGIGRSQISLPTFEEHFWSWSNIAPPTDFQLRTTSVKGLRNFNSNGTLTQSDIDEITGQDIQLSATVSMEVVISAVLPDLVVPDTIVSVSAQFAPKTHIRPEWEVEHFPGGEQGLAPPKPPQLVQIVSSMPAHLPPLGRLVTRHPGGR